jgi:hypothetical protein
MWNEENDNTAKQINKQADERWRLEQIYSHICQSYGIKHTHLWQGLWVYDDDNIPCFFFCIHKEMQIVQAL